MFEMIKNILGGILGYVLIILFICFFAIGVPKFIGNAFKYFFNDTNEVSKTDVISESKKRRLEEDSVAVNFANKYQALISWEEDFTYSIQLQKILSTGKPIALRGYIEDVFSQGTKNFIRFQTSYLSESKNKYNIVLECNSKIIDKIVDPDSRENFNDAIVIANIKEISIPSALLHGYEDGGEIETELDTSNLFIGKGSCVDLLYLPST
jgi:hypothetical protein